MKTPWVSPYNAPAIEQSIHDYIVSIFRQLTGPERKVEIVPISPGAEATRGWDAAVMEVVPLYLQYKYPDFTSRPWSSQPSAFKYRRGWAFDDSDGVFHFHLRAKAEKAPKSQHELMFDLQSTGKRVFYVAPTFIDVKRLRSGGDPLYDRPWLNSRLSFRRGYLVDFIPVPYFDGLICIPPHVSVADAPENHVFYFNAKHEVSFHSDPAIVESRDFEAVIADQIDDILSSRTITRNNVELYVQEVLALISGETNQNGEIIKDYFSANLGRTEAARRNPLMQNMRALAKLMRKLYGIEVLLTCRREPQR
jgi:hypothetical protein